MYRYCNFCKGNQKGGGEKVQKNNNDYNVEFRFNLHEQDRAWLSYTST